MGYLFPFTMVTLAGKSFLFYSMRSSQRWARCSGSKLEHVNPASAKGSFLREVCEQEVRSKYNTRFDSTFVEANRAQENENLVYGGSRAVYFLEPPCQKNESTVARFWTKSLQQYWKDILKAARKTAQEVAAAQYTSYPRTSKARMTTNSADLHAAM